MSGSSWMICILFLVFASVIVSVQQIGSDSSGMGYKIFDWLTFVIFFVEVREERRTEGWGEATAGSESPFCVLFQARVRPCPLELRGRLYGISTSVYGTSIHSVDAHNILFGSCTSLRSSPLYAVFPSVRVLVSSSLRSSLPLTPTLNANHYN